MTRIVIVLDFTGDDAEDEAYDLVNKVLDHGAFQVELSEERDGDIELVSAVVPPSGKPEDVSPPVEEISDEGAEDDGA